MNLVHIELLVSQERTKSSVINSWPAEVEFGDLHLRDVDLSLRLGRINQLIDQISCGWTIIQNNEESPQDMSTKSAKLAEHGFLLEEVIYHVKACCDIIVSTCCLIEKYKATQIAPRKVPITDIGMYLCDGQNESHLFDDYKKYLQVVNDHANSYKHSFTNSYVNVIGQDEPCCFSSYTKRGKMETAKPMGHSLNEIIGGLNDLYEKYIDFNCS